MKKFLSILFILFISMQISACGKKQNAMPQAIVDTKEINEQQIVETMNSTGRIIAKYDVDIIARVDGYLEKRFFDEGATVKKGDLLFQIEPYSYAAKVSQAAANLRNSQAALVDSSKNLKRAEQLVKEDFISKSDYDSTLALRDKDKAAVDSNKAALQQAQINYGYTKIYSPIDGKIGKILITEGNYVTPSTGKLATIVSMNPIFVDFTLKSKNYLSLKKASKMEDLSDISVEITLADDTVYPKKGKITFVDNVIDVSSGTVEFRAVFDNSEKLLVPGDYVSVKLSLNTPKTVLMVPQEAVLESADGKYLYVIDENKIAKKKMITVAEEYKGNWIVVDGVQANDNVAISGLQYIQPEQKVILNAEMKKEKAIKSEVKSVGKPSFFQKLKKKIKKVLNGLVERFKHE